MREATLLSVILALMLVPGQSAWAAENGSPVPVKIMFTHDLHSYFLPYPLFGDNGEVEMAGGYDRLAAVIEEQRRLNPEASLLLDGGDFSMGTLFQTQFREQALELRLMGKMGYECTTLGNHEFDTDSRGLARMLETARQSGEPLPQVLCSNIAFRPGQEEASGLREAMAHFPVKDYTIIEKQGLRIGIFGLIGRDAAQVTVLGQDIDFQDPVEEGRRVAAILKDQEKADIIICLSHSGTRPEPARSEDQLLAQEVPDIDVIISGHTHTLLEEPIICGDTVIGSAGSYGRCLGVMDLLYTPGQGTRLIDYQLLEIDGSITGDPEVRAVIEDYKSIVDREFLAPFGYTFDQKIAESDFSLESLESVYDNPRETGLGDLVADSYRYAVEKAEGPGYQYLHAAVQAQGEIRSSLAAGPLSTDDIFRVLSLGLGPDQSVGYPLVGIYLNGNEIKNCLEIEATVAPLKGNNDYRMQVSGLVFKYNPNRLPFNRVYDVMVSTPSGGYEALDEEGLYRVCASYYAASMLGKMGDQTYGMVNVTPKDASGEPLAHLDQAVIDADYSRPGLQELKQWPALASYLQSMPDTDGNGIPNLAPRYQKAAGRYDSFPSWNPVNLLQEPNRITWGAMIITAGVLSAGAGMARWLKRRRSRAV